MVPLYLPGYSAELMHQVGAVMMHSTEATNATKLTASLWHYCQHLYLLALPVSLSFPLARLLIALGPGLFTFTLCCPPPRRQVGKTMQTQAELSDGLLKGLKSPYHWEVPLEGEASEAICLLYVYFLKQWVQSENLGVFLLHFLWKIPIMNLQLILWTRSPLCCSWEAVFVLPCHRAQTLSQG